MLTLLPIPPATEPPLSRWAATVHLIDVLGLTYAEAVAALDAARAATGRRWCECAELVCDHRRHEHAERPHADATAEAARERATVPADDDTTDGVETEFPW